MTNKKGKGRLLNKLRKKINQKGVTFSMSNNNRSRCRKAIGKIHYENTTKKLTSNAGLIPVIQFMQKVLKFSITSANSVEHQRGDTAKYSLSDALEIVILGLIGGAYSLYKIANFWASDTVLQQLGGWKSVPDNSTLGRIFQGLNYKQSVQLETLNHLLRKKTWNKAKGKSLLSRKQRINHWIDGDSTVQTVYGNQEGAQKGYNPHKKGAKSYHPLLAFSTHTKELLQGWLRCGSAYTSNGIVEFMSQLLRNLDYGTRIIFRADSGFFASKLMDFLDNQRHGYLIKVKLKNIRNLLNQQEWNPIPRMPQWEQCEFYYRANGWIRSRRFVAVRYAEKVHCSLPINSYRYHYYCYVTTEPLTPWQAHKSYGKRATCENFIEESKNQIGLGKLKTKDFWANSALFQCAIMAYNIIRWMALLTGDKLLQRFEVGSIRTFFIRVAGKLVKGSNQLRIKTPTHHLYQNQWKLWSTIEHYNCT